MNDNNKMKFDPKRRSVLRSAGLAGLAGLAATVPFALQSGLAQAAQRKLLRLYTYPPGAYGQVAAVTWQKLIYGSVPSARLETLPASGREQYLDFAGAPPERQRHMLLTMLTIEAALAPQGKAPWPKPTVRPMALLTFSPNSAVSLFTNDPEIKTIYDLDGKRVDVGLPGTYVENSQSPLLKAAGIDFRPVPSFSIADGWQRLRDGVVDATGAGIIDMRLLPPGPADVLRMQKVYQVHVPEEVFAKAREMSGIPFLPIRTPHGAYRETYGLDYSVSRPQEGVLAPAFTAGFWSSPDLEEEIAYEITRAALEQVEVFGEDHALGKLLRGRIGHMTVPQDEFHPGARRAYEELGVSYGLEGIAAFEKTPS